MEKGPEDCYVVSDWWIEDIVLHTRGIVTYKNYQIREEYRGTRLVLSFDAAEELTKLARPTREDEFPDQSRRLVCYVPTFAQITTSQNGKPEYGPIALRRKREKFSSWGVTEKSRPSRVRAIQRELPFTKNVAQTMVALSEELDIRTINPPNERFAIELTPIGFIYDPHADTIIPKNVPPVAVVVFCLIKSGVAVRASEEEKLTPQFFYAHRLLPRIDNPESAIPPRPQGSGVFADALYVMAYNGLYHTHGETLDHWGRLTAMALMERYQEVMSSSQTTVVTADEFKTVKKVLGLLSKT